MSNDGSLIQVVASPIRRAAHANTKKSGGAHLRSSLPETVEYFAQTAPGLSEGENLVSVQALANCTQA